MSHLSIVLKKLEKFFRGILFGACVRYIDQLWDKHIITVIIAELTRYAYLPLQMMRLMGLTRLVTLRTDRTTNMFLSLGYDVIEDSS